MVDSLSNTVLWGILYSSISFSSFYTLNWIIYLYYVPDHLKANATKQWRWNNYAVSFVHSTLSGILALVCLVLYPELFRNIITGYSELGYFACCVSYGYFWYDTFDLVRNRDKDKGNSELVVHHGFALTSASLVVFTKTFVGFGATSLLIELHSCTLHMRVLLKMYQNSATSISYFILKFINMGTFFIFRFAAIFYLVYALFRDRYSAPVLGIYIFMSLALSAILFLSCLLLLRVVRGDFITKRADSVKAPDVLFGITPLTGVSNGLVKGATHG